MICAYFCSYPGGEEKEMAKQSSVEKYDRKKRQGVDRWRRKRRRQKETGMGEERSSGNYGNNKDQGKKRNQ